MRKLYILGLLMAGGCTHTVQPDHRDCCARVSLHNKEMKKFNRYCKVALFLHRSNTLSDPQIKENVKTAVDVCKFVLMADTEEQLLSTVELNDTSETQQVRKYIIKPDAGESFWRQDLHCDPAEFACEEF